MKTFALVAVLICLAAAVVRSDEMNVGSAYGGAAPASSGGYGGGSASIPAPPCPKNYLFSCQPSLQPAPCAQSSSSSYGSVGAYSANYPVYTLQVPQYVRGFKTH